MALVLLWFWGCVRLAGAAGEVRNEYALKAAFLVNFAAYVTWPAEAFPNAEAPIFIGVLGDDPFGGNLAAAAQKIGAVGPQKRRIMIKRSKKVDDLKGCHIVFVGRSENDQVPQILAALGQAKVLTVGETEGFAIRGGVINFYIADDTIRFEINNDLAVRRGLTIDSRLLRLAKVVS